MTKPSALHNHLYYLLHTKVFISIHQYNGTAYHCNITWLLPEDYLTITLINTCFEITELRNSRSWRERQRCTGHLWHITLTNPTLHVHSFQEERLHRITRKRSGERWVMWNKEHIFRRYESWCCLPRSMTWHPRGALIKASVVLLPFCLSVFCISKQAVCSQLALCMR